jgi:hypothetical protein
MVKKATVTEADMRRAIKAARGSGLVITECIMSPQEVRLIFDTVDAPQTMDNNGKPEAWPELR